MNGGGVIVCRNALISMVVWAVRLHIVTILSVFAIIGGGCSLAGS